ncbi:MAG: YqzL family protein [Clostridiales bacterium]|nr:YqzL family protein [Clostridiales bacterium]
MLLETIWKTFEITGSIDAYMCYKEIEQVSQKETKEKKADEK